MYRLNKKVDLKYIEVKFSFRRLWQMQRRNAIKMVLTPMYEQLGSPHFATSLSTISP
ncbi:hypothetical protein KIN20_020224 [Parelaphostrongylus tenuis]|uniref:Uncharacterized protein n=1 Tax=Parelaphostrongylus tenuis TaxID=148309 RepID=A0AAD5MM46_PARTN|nr:hypothetical protein KIN20_020224 [Parelaphostrongylus tenuis]